MKTLLGHKGYVCSVCFSPDGRRIASGSHNKSVKIWDALSGDCIQTLSGHKFGVSSVCFSPDGKKVVASDSDDKPVKIWDTADDNRSQRKSLFGVLHS